jgi:chromosome segregation ATPase
VGTNTEIPSEGGPTDPTWVDDRLKDFKIFELEDQVRFLQEANQQLKDGLAKAKASFHKQIQFADEQRNELSKECEKWADQYYFARQKINDLSQENFNLKDDLRKLRSQGNSNNNNNNNKEVDGFIVIDD